MSNSANAQRVRKASQDALLAQHLTVYFGDLEREAMALLHNRLQWVEIQGERPC